MPDILCVEEGEIEEEREESGTQLNSTEGVRAAVAAGVVSRGVIVTDTKHTVNVSMRIAVQDTA
jgi:hypothetical protein